MVLSMTGQKMVPVYLCLCLVHLAAVCRHQPFNEINYTLWSRDPSPESIAVGRSHPVHLTSLASRDILDLSALGWYVIVRYLATLAVRHTTRKVQSRRSSSAATSRILSSQPCHYWLKRFQGIAQRPLPSRHGPRTDLQPSQPATSK